MKLSTSALHFPVGKNYQLWINCLSGAIDIVPAGSIKKLSTTNLAKLSQRGYFDVPHGRIDILKKLKKLADRHSQSTPYWFYVLTTLACNFKCPICYEREKIGGGRLTTANLQQIITTIKHLQKRRHIKNQRIFLVIFGGEPLCLPNSAILEGIFKEALRNHWKCIIVSNGSLVNHHVKVLKKYQKVIADFRITIDGPKKIHNSRRPYQNSRGSFDDVVVAVELLLKNKFSVKCQTILGAGNIAYLKNIVKVFQKKKWLSNKYFSWRVEGSHDYANLDPKKDEVSEAKMVKQLIDLVQTYPILRDKMKFESFKYLSHIVSSFGWLGEYKTYWGPRFNFCDPQRGFHYVFSTDGAVYHCPRTINNRFYKLGRAGKFLRAPNWRNKNILVKSKCRACPLNTLCGGGCLVQKRYQSNFNCQKYVLRLIQEFVVLMSKPILNLVKDNEVVSINKPW